MDEQLKFTVAILTDTHLRAPGGDQSSPYAVNDHANGRARYAVEVVRANTRALTIHLGDIVHPLPELPAFGPACEEAHRIFAPLKPEIHFVPGNHDIGDKPGLASPAGPVTEGNRTAYETTFGSSWSSVDHDGATFVIINSSLVNTGGAAEKEQQDWLEQTLKKATGRRVFLFSHYPPFINEPDEAEHYDNYAEPGRSWLLDLAAEHRVEAIFSGHVHQFFFNRYRGVKLYCLPPISFIRQDYAELYRGNPTAEFGRDDVGKYGVTLLDIFADGHRLRFAPTHGRELVEGGPAPEIQATRQPVTALVPHLRHAWFETTTLPYSGPMEEFSRKRARNDYPLLRMWQLGISNVRTPLQDLIDPVSRNRILDFAATGMTFTFFSLGLPTPAAVALLKEHRNLVGGLEVVSTNKALVDVGAGLEGLVKLLGVPVTVSKSTTSADEPRRGSAFAHNVSTGFLWQEKADAIAAASKLGLPDGSFGLSFQINLDEDPGERIPELAGELKRIGARLTAVIRLADRNPANANFDDDKILARLVAALAAADGLENVDLQCDTFEDIDRGFSPRHGLLDRQSNFRPVAAHLANSHGR